jgi:hypothetical protein
MKTEQMIQDVERPPIVSETERRLNAVADRLKVLLAVEVLEYFDRNWLALDERRRSENRQELLCEMITTMKVDGYGS